jgi:arabinofuranan 3-O-arabinosyltransferase
MARTSRSLPAVALAAVAYVPLLLTAPGVVVADTKSYLYLDPSRMLSRAWSMWDPSIGAGTVTHQNIGYLWPIGPWYWCFDRLGVPAWVAQRLWLGTILLLAGFGVVWLLRTLGWRGPEPWTAAFAYALTPYVLTVAARISVLLLPFAALPWLIGLTVRALRDRGWRWPALFALTVTTVGSVNLTALVLAGVGPVLWVVYALAAREVTGKRALATVGRIGLLTIPVCAWWLAGLWVQGGWGIDILRYTETAEVVAQASTANEVLRGLGYWFFYGGDKLGPWIEPSFTYTQKLVVLALSYAIPIVALAGLSLTRFRHRSFFVLLTLTGVVLAVGAHPWDDPTIAGRAFEAFLQSDYGLSMRSLPRAVPVVALGLSVGLAALVSAVAARVPRVRWLAVAAVMTVTVANLPTLWTLKMVPANLRRDEQLPAYWDALAAHLDGRGAATRVLELPGADFASYRWGNTVDPVLPGLMDRPYVARELIPYGTPPSADLLIALDHRLQERIVDPRALAPIARLLSAGDISVRSDLQYERYNTPRPKNLWQLLRGAPGLAAPTGFGEPLPHLSVNDASLYDELFLQTPSSWEDPPPVAAFAVDGAPNIVRVQRPGPTLLVAGDGEGLVDAAEAGLIDGRELVLYSASDTATALRERASRGAVLLVTDSNRRRGRRWTSVRHNAGATTPAGEQPLVTDLTDNELPVFGPASDDTMTVVDPRGGIRAQATSYGNPFTFTPEERAANAVDGDPLTAWRAAAFSKSTGERLVLTFDSPMTTDHVTLLQPLTGQINRSITAVRLHFDDGSVFDAALDDSSNREPGQRVDFPSRTFSKLTLEIRADSAGSPPRYNGLTSEGFAEVRVGDASPRLDEIIRPPIDLLEAVGPSSVERPLTFLFTRQRSAPTDPTRSDEELSIIRAVDVPADRSYAVFGTARLNAWASDTVLDDVVQLRGGVSATSAARLQGDRTARGSAAFDGDPATAWTGQFDRGEQAWVSTTADAAVTADHIGLTVRADGFHSVPTTVHVVADGRDLGPIEVPAVLDGTDLDHVETVTLALPVKVTARSWTVQVSAVRSVETVSWESNDATSFPVSIAEVAIGDVRTSPPPATFDSGCRGDLLTVDGGPVPVRISGTTAAAVHGEPLTLASCGVAPLSLGAGEHVLRAAPGLTTGLDVDQVALRSAAGGAAEGSTGLLAPTMDGPGATIAVSSDGPARIKATVTGATPGEPLWIVLGQSYSSGWSATVAGRGAGDPHLVDGYANGWLVTPDQSSFDVMFAFTPQRTVNAMLVVSAVAAVCCVGLAAWPRRRRYRSADAPDHVFAGLREAPLPWMPRALAATGSGLLALVLAGPVVGAVVAVAVLVGGRGGRAGLLVRSGAPGALGLAALYVIVQQIRHSTAPGLDWPAELERAHPVGWLAILLLAADLVLCRLRCRSGTQVDKERQ